MKGKRYQLTTAGRPSQVSWWVSRGRDFSKPPDASRLGKPSEFGALWRGWWIKMQPSWRGTEWPLSRAGLSLSESWPETLKGGRNGMEAVLITLSWWCSVVKSESQRREWDSAVEDVSWVLEQMVRYMKTSPAAGEKRPAESEPADAPVAKR